MSHVTRVNESWHTYEAMRRRKAFAGDVFMSHVTNIRESWHTYYRVMAHIRSNKSRHTYA